MNWEVIVAIIEVLGLIAVVVSLVYLAVQVRQNSQLISQNTMVARSAMVHETSVFHARFFELLAEHPELANILRRAKGGEELDADEIVRFEALIEIYFTSLEDMDHQYKSGLYFEEDDDEDLIRYMAPAYREILMCKYGSGWWDQTARDKYAPSFYEKIQAIRAEWNAERK